MITATSLSPAVDKIYFADDFEAGKLYRVGKVVKSAGGKGINVARVASILGEKVTSAGFKAGHTGEWLEDQLAKLKVDTRFIAVEGESRTNNNIIDRKNNTETEVLEIGPYITCEDKNKFLETFQKVLSYTKILVCSGGLPEGIPPDFYRTLIEMANSSGIKVILDSSNEMLSEGIKAKPYIIKPNLRELSRYAGKGLSTMDEIIGACREIIEKGIHGVAASLGKDGAVLVTADRVLRIGNPGIEVVNTIGSGDSMVAGMAVGLLREYSLEDAFKLGVACAMANTQFVEIGFVSMELVDRFLKQIRLEKISYKNKL